MSKRNQHKENKFSLKGTFASVMIVGAVIVVCWLGMFMVYISRG